MFSIWMSNFICECCSYATDRKQNYDRHCVSKRHQRLTKLLENKVIAKTSDEIIENSVINGNSKNEDLIINRKETGDISTEKQNYKKKFGCKYCLTRFTTKQAMYRHIKYVCKNNEQESFEELVRLMNLKLDKQNKMLQGEIQKRDNAIKKLTKKLEIVNFGAPTVMNNVTHSNNKTLNSYTAITNNINNNINIVNFKDTDLSMIPVKRMGIIYSRYTNCVPQCVKEAHCNEKYPQHMNIYISNVRGKYVMVYENNDWQLREREETLEKLINDKNVQLEEWLDEHGHKYPEMMKKFKHYMTLYNNDNGSLMAKIKERVKIELYNVRKLVREFNILRTRQVKQFLKIDDIDYDDPLFLEDVLDIENYEDEFKAITGITNLSELMSAHDFDNLSLDDDVGNNVYLDNTDLYCSGDENEFT